MHTTTVAQYQGHHNWIPKLTLLWRKNSRAQMMAKQRVAVVDEQTAPVRRVAMPLDHG
jgi:hypothetical protein